MPRGDLLPSRWASRLERLAAVTSRDEDGLRAAFVEPGFYRGTIGCLIADVP
jgi:hypothetical protein